MLYYVVGDIFESSAETIVNPVNTSGTMDSGLAKEYKKRYPHTFARYKYACDNGLFAPGSLLLTKEKDHLVLCIPTKAGQEDPSKLSFIEAGLKAFRKNYEAKGITSVAFPMLGCGPGGLCKNQAETVFDRYLGTLPIDILVYKNIGENNDSKNSERQELSA